jgi:NTE family protein
MDDPTKPDVAKFIKDSGAEEILKDLQASVAAKRAAGKPFIVSDVFDGEGNQYVDLVQEGGGVWGVALLGYTYILEKMGIRFFSLAGTSAGAINTMLMAATNDKQEEKAEKIIDVILQLDMFSFVDGKKGNWAATKWVKRNIQKFIVQKNYLKKIKTTVIILLAAFVLFSLGAFITSLVTSSTLLKVLSIAALGVWVIVLFLLLFLKGRIKTIAKTGYGLNEGRAFYNWMTGVLHDNKIMTLEDLKTHFCKTPPGLQVRRDANRDNVDENITPPSSPMLIIVASDITTGSKIEFPRMWKMYWEKLADVNPAVFVRASMSIPVFFETYKIPVSPTIEDPVNTWQELLNWNGAIPKTVEMVDGGVLSNFPINVFYNAKYIIPRMPTFGIRLGGSGIKAANEINSVTAYLSSLISTLRSNTDKEFINKNKAFELGVKEVDLSGYSWLNFFMNDDEKKAIFKKGAQAAADFLLNFDWEDYKLQRFNNSAVLEQQLENPNNW